MGLRDIFPLAKIESKEEGELAAIYIATKWVETAKRHLNCRNTAISRQGLRKISSTTTKKTSTSAKCIQSIWKEIKNRYCSLTFAWIKVHSSIRGNKEADRAKKLTAGLPAKMSIKPSVTTKKGDNRDHQENVTKAVFIAKNYHRLVLPKTLHNHASLPSYLWGIEIQASVTLQSLPWQTKP